MILVLTCTCGGVEQLARATLKEGGHPDWLNYPVYKGRQECMRQLEKIEDEFGDTPQYGALHGKMKSGSGRFVVILGFMKNGEKKSIRWADIARGKITDMMDARIIVSEYM